MSRTTAEGKVKLYFLPAIANEDAPTAAELAAGTPLTPQLPTGGVDITFTQNNASISMLEESFSPEEPGTESASMQLTWVRDDTDDDLWDLFERGLRGFILVSRFGVPGAGDPVEVYPISSHDPVPLAPAENEYQQARVTLPVTDKPSLKAVMAA